MPYKTSKDYKRLIELLKRGEEIICDDGTKCTGLLGGGVSMFFGDIFDTYEEFEAYCKTVSLTFIVPHDYAATPGDIDTDEFYKDENNEDTMTTEYSIPNSNDSVNITVCLAKNADSAKQPDLSCKSEKQSVWHTADEEPKDGSRLVLCDGKVRTFMAWTEIRCGVLFFINDSGWVIVYKDLKEDIRKWAYVSELAEL